MSKSMNKIWACEKNYLLDYLSKVENASPEDRQAAIDQYSTTELPDIMSIDSDGTAIINIVGPLSRRGPSWIDRLFGYGGTSYGDILKSIAAVTEQGNIEKVILRMDTPGGEVVGVDKVNIAVSELSRSGVEVVAENHGMIASAGVWIAAACDKIVAMEKTCFTGSIGVIITAVDYSKLYEENGIKVVNILSRNAPNKRPDIKTKAGVQILQDRADAIERQFIERVAAGRKVSTSYVIDNFGQGDLLIAFDPDSKKPTAVSVGLIDSVVQSGEDDNMPQVKDDGEDMDVDGAHDENSEPSALADRSTPEAPQGAGDNTEETMNLSEFLASNPDAKKAYESALADARAEGVEEGKKTVEARIEKAKPYIGNKEYPDAIQALAAKVASGEEDPAALTGAVTVFDATKENKASDAAQAETEEIGETAADAGNDPVDEVKSAIEADRKAMGGE